MKRSIAITTILGLVLTYLIVQTTRTAKVLLTANQIKSILQSESNSLGVERVNLQNEVEFGLTDQFIEREARDRLNYGRDGETVLLMPKK